MWDTYVIHKKIVRPTCQWVPIPPPRPLPLSSHPPSLPPPSPAPTAAVSHGSGAKAGDRRHRARSPSDPVAGSAGIEDGTEAEERLRLGRVPAEGAHQDAELRRRILVVPVRVEEGERPPVSTPPASHSTPSHQFGISPQKMEIGMGRSRVAACPSPPQ